MLKADQRIGCRIWMRTCSAPVTLPARMIAQNGMGAPRPASRQGAYPLSFDLVAAAARMAAIARQFCYVFVVFTLLAAIFLVRHHAGT